MEYEKSRERHTPRCLECGDRISYGRSDKKFCSDDCRNRHHNHLARSSRILKRRITSALDRNYEILDNMLKDGTGSIRMEDAIFHGFNPHYATSFRKQGRHVLYHCYDICYMMTPSRISSISKIQNLSLPLQAIDEFENQQ